MGIAEGIYLIESAGIEDREPEQRTPVERIMCQLLDRMRQARDTGVLDPESQISKKAEEEIARFHRGREQSLLERH